LIYIFQKSYSEALSQEEEEFYDIKTRILNNEELCEQVEDSVKYAESQINNLESQIEIYSNYQEGQYRLSAQIQISRCIILIEN
jgi:hypothetical protein